MLDLVVIEDHSKEVPAPEREEASMQPCGPRTGKLREVLMPGS